MKAHATKACVAVSVILEAVCDCVTEAHHRDLNILTSVTQVLSSFYYERYISDVRSKIFLLSYYCIISFLVCAPSPPCEQLVAALC